MPVTGGDFSQLTYKINPGLSLTFPWLSQLAPNFEYYRVVDMDFEFVSKLPTTAAGMVYLAIDYNAADPPVVESE